MFLMKFFDFLFYSVFIILVCSSIFYLVNSNNNICKNVNFLYSDQKRVEDRWINIFFISLFYFLCLSFLSKLDVFYNFIPTEYNLLRLIFSFLSGIRCPPSPFNTTWSLFTETILSKIGLVISSKFILNVIGIIIYTIIFKDFLRKIYVRLVKEVEKDNCVISFGKDNLVQKWINAIPFFFYFFYVFYQFGILSVLSNNEESLSRLLYMNIRSKVDVYTLLHPEIAGMNVFVVNLPILEYSLMIYSFCYIFKLVYYDTKGIVPIKILGVLSALSYILYH